MLRKYFGIVFIVSIMIGVLHHHNDLREHNDCKICIIQSNIVDMDTPVDTLYVDTLKPYKEGKISKLPKLYSFIFKPAFSSRAPPKS